MPRGRSDIPDLRLETLQRFTTKWQTPPELLLYNMFPKGMSESATIKWESQTGARSMVPFKAPGQKTPSGTIRGIGSHSAEAAFMGEKIYYDEEFLNNLRQPGTTATYMTAQRRLSTDLADLTNRCYRRAEWMMAKVVSAGSFSYKTKNEHQISLDYSIPSSHIVSLSAAASWYNGTSKNIIGDIMDGCSTINDDCGAKPKLGICNSTTFKSMVLDTAIQTLLQSSSFGKGNLFGPGNPIVGAKPEIVASLTPLPQIYVYDDVYEVRAQLTAVVTGASTTVVSVDNASDFEVGGTLKFVDVSAGTYETETISSVDENAGTVTVSSAPTASFKAGEDYVSMTKKYIADYKFIILGDRVDNNPVMEFIEAPYGNSRRYGVQPDQWEEKDPEGVWIRIEYKGLPVLYHRDALYILTVHS